MLTEQHQTMLKMLKDVKITKYVTHEKYIELEVVDKDGNKMEIKFYPKNKII